MDRIITAGWRLVAALMLIFAVLAVAGTASAATPNQPATREYVARILVERALLSDVPARDRHALWQGTECFGDGYDMSWRSRRRACWLRAMGIMGDTGRNSAYPTFEPTKHVRRDQMASIVMRLATQEGVVLPDHAATFIDVSSRNAHADAIRWGAYHGIIRGFDTTPATFRPAAPVTRRQVRVLVARVVDHWRHGTR